MVSTGGKDGGRENEGSLLMESLEPKISDNFMEEFKSILSQFSI